MAHIPMDNVNGMFLPFLNMDDFKLICGNLGRLKDVIQNLFELQSGVHGYLGPDTQQELVRKVYHHAPAHS